ncbi:ABC transporter ATP-binding protein [Clostridium tagluense]|uniref:HlyB/MsbA family ABC transporter n=1 Tax=Clostridium tagluense TaxID=360422 RepID=A0A401UL56_9CLOT|nr:ABC transporter ATP-binding protein [Clostridium tagluense]GCD10280.1 HlyB/MsbA family ABC transporter [Clostridium tagluense]
MESNSKNIKTFNYVWELIKYKPWLYLITVISWTASGIIPLIQGIMVKGFFDIIEGKPSLKIGIDGLLFLIVIITLIRILIIQLGFRTDVSNKFLMSALLRGNILNCILKKPGSKAIQTSIGEVINSFRDDVEQVESSIGWLSWLIGQIVFSLIALIIMIRINTKITLLVFVPLTAVIVLAQKSEKKVEKNREKSRQATGNVTGAVGEIFESVLAIKVSGEEKSVINNLKNLNEERHHLMLKDSLLTQLIDSVYNNAVTLGTGLILLLAAQVIRSGSFTVGDFALFIYYLAFVTDSIESLGNFLVHYKQTGVAFKRMANLIQSKDSDELVKHKPIHLKEGIIKKSNGNRSGKIKDSLIELSSLEVKSLNFCYENSQKGISNINFSLNKGEVTVICGRTGSGKSTVLKTLLGLLPADSGEVYWNGEIIKNLQSFFVPPISAYTSQVPNLFSATVRNNILLGLSEDEVDLRGAINLAVLEKDTKQLENGLDTVIGSKGVKLSGGQLQRVAVARMFVRNAQLIVVDDISSALDRETEKTLWKRLFKDNLRTCIIVSNKRFAMEQADNIILMKGGNIEAQGSLMDLLAECKEMQEIWN